MEDVEDIVSFLERYQQDFPPFGESILLAIAPNAAESAIAQHFRWLNSSKIAVDRVELAPGVVAYRLVEPDIYGSDHGYSTIGSITIGATSSPNAVRITFHNPPKIRPETVAIPGDRDTEETQEYLNNKALTETNRRQAIFEALTRSLLQSWLKELQLVQSKDRQHTIIQSGPISPNKSTATVYNELVRDSERYSNEDIRCYCADRIALLRELYQAPEVNSENEDYIFVQLWYLERIGNRGATWVKVAKLANIGSDTLQRDRRGKFDADYPAYPEMNEAALEGRRPTRRRKAALNKSRRASKR